jgi:hypothetical protein
VRGEEIVKSESGGKSRIARRTADSALEMNIQSCDCANRFSSHSFRSKSPLFDGRQGGAVHDRVNRFNDRFLPDLSRFIYFRSNHDRSSILGCRQTGREKTVRSLFAMSAREVEQTSAPRHL